jgi:hypothetical protein
VWHFEGVTYTRYRTGLNYTFLSNAAYTPPLAASTCSGAGTEQGLFSLSKLDGKATLNLQGRI